MLYKTFIQALVFIGCFGAIGEASAYVPTERAASAIAGLDLRPSYNLDQSWLQSKVASSGPELIMAKYTPTPVTPSNSPGGYGIFGSVAIPVSTVPALKKWNRVAAARFECARRQCDSIGGRLNDTIALASGKSAYEALSLVNGAVNHLVRYRADRDDVWSTPGETIARGAGDCEDFAIAKMSMLREMGYGSSQLQLVVLRNKKSGAFHAVLVVHVGDANYVLDNLSDRVLQDGKLKSYVPIQSFVGNRIFIHGFANRSVESASLAP